MVKHKRTGKLVPKAEQEESHSLEEESKINNLDDF
jgi:hypothetical protein